MIVYTLILVLAAGKGVAYPPTLTSQKLEFLTEMECREAGRRFMNTLPEQYKHNSFYNCVESLGPSMGG